MGTDNGSPGSHDSPEPGSCTKYATDVERVQRQEILPHTRVNTKPDQGFSAERKPDAHVGSNLVAFRPCHNST